MVFIVEAGELELIKIRYNFQNEHCWALRSTQPPYVALVSASGVLSKFLKMRISKTLLPSQKVYLVSR